MILIFVLIHELAIRRVRRRGESPIRLAELMSTSRVTLRMVQAGSGQHIRLSREAQ